VLVHNGDHSAALIDAGDNLLTIGGVSFNKALQRDHMQKEAQQPKVEFDIDDLLTAQESRNGTESKTKDDPEKPKTPFSMKSFSLSGQSETMKTKMLADRYVCNTRTGDNNLRQAEHR
jgi:hypothetical protein